MSAIKENNNLMVFKNDCLSDGFWTGLKTDLTIEQTMMRALKSSGC